MRRQVCAALIVVAASLTGAQVTRPDLARLLATRVTNYPVKAANLLEAVAQISSEFNIPVGIEWNHAPTAQRIITGEWTGTTVGQVLSEVVAEDPAYELGISNGVVHVRPRGFARNPANFLNITLASFTAKDQYTQTIGFALRDRLNETFTRKPPPAAACAGSTGIGADERLTSLSLRNVTVGNVLDALLVRSRYSMWLVTFDPARSYNGFLDTNSLWRKITEQDQPNWDYVSRYFDPVQLKRRADWIFWKPRETRQPPTSPAPANGSALFALIMVIIDKTYGHASYGCMMCCGVNYGWFDPDPWSGGIGFSGAGTVFGMDNCMNVPDDITNYYSSWSTGNSSVTTASPGLFTARGVGSTWGSAFGNIPNGNGDYTDYQCPTTPDQPAVTTNVVPTLTGVSPSSGAVGAAISVTLSGTGLSSSLQIMFSGSGITASNVSSPDSGHLSATFNISSSASPGQQMITLGLPGQPPSNAVGFDVIPFIGSITPSRGLAGTFGGRNNRGQRLQQFIHG